MAATTTRRKPVHHESLEQRAVVQWADMTRLPGSELRVGDWLFAVPNGGARRPVEAAIMKAEGVRAGVPDLFLALPVAPYAGLFCEMKRADGGSTTKEQKAWLTKLSTAGYMTSVCHGAEEAIDTIKRYVGL